MHNFIQARSPYTDEELDEAELHVAGLTPFMRADDEDPPVLGGLLAARLWRDGLARQAWAQLHPELHEDDVEHIPDVFFG